MKDKNEEENQKIMRYFTVIECTIIQFTNASSRDWFSETNEIVDIGFSQ